MGEEITMGNVGKKLAVSQGVIDSMPVDVADMIVTDEFRRPCGGGDDYRERALDRLCKLPFRWSSEGNILRAMVGRFIKVACPRCGGDTVMFFSSGSGTSMTFRFVCKNEKCLQEIALSLEENAFDVKASSHVQSDSHVA